MKITALYITFTTYNAVTFIFFDKLNTVYDNTIYSVRLLFQMVELTRIELVSENKST